MSWGQSVGLRHHDPANVFGGERRPPAHGVHGATQVGKDVPERFGLAVSIGEEPLFSVLFFGEATDAMFTRDLARGDRGPDDRRPGGSHGLECSERTFFHEAGEDGQLSVIDHLRDDPPFQAIHANQDDGMGQPAHFRCFFLRAGDNHKQREEQ